MARENEPNLQAVKNERDRPLQLRHEPIPYHELQENTLQREARLERRDLERRISAPYCNWIDELQSRWKKR